MNKVRWVDDAINIIKKMGGRVEKVHNKHIMVFIYINNKMISWSTPCTPSDVRTQKNCLADLKRKLREIGVEPPQFTYRGENNSNELHNLWQIIETSEM